MTTVTVCGSAGSYPAVARACSSYLLEHAGDSLVIDIGNGSLSNLQRWRPLGSISDIFISHDHHDHVADLIGLLQMTSFGSAPPPRLRVHCRPSTAHTLRDLQRLHAPQDRALEFVELNPGDKRDRGRFVMDVYPTTHSRDGLCLRVTDSEGGVIAYTGDSALSDELVRCARDADLLISEATWLADTGPYPGGVHMTGREAGELARAAGVSRLMITHVWPEFSPYDVAKQAAAVFQGPTLVAQDNMVTDIGAER